MGYRFTFQGAAYEPHGKIDRHPLDDSDRHNREIEAREIEWLKAAPDHVVLYMKTPPDPQNDPRAWYVTTWLGTIVSSYLDGQGFARALVGPSRSFPCFGPFPSKRRSVDCRIFGVRYVGWYYESSGDYCRLRKSKRQ